MSKTNAFVQWNDLLLREFFSPSVAGEEVWLNTSRFELDSFGLHLGGGEGLIRAVKAGPGWLQSGLSDCAQEAACLARQRQFPRTRPAAYVDPSLLSPQYARMLAPTYLPFLAIWVLASSETEKNGFYARVSDLLGGGRFEGNQLLTEAMMDVWNDLEAWSCEQTQGRFGEFRVRVVGQHRYIGVPRSQCLVSRRDSRGLRQIFYSHRLRAGGSLTNKTFTSLLHDGRHSPFLTAALRDAMGRQAFEEPLRALLPRSLRDWNGRDPSQLEDMGGSRAEREAHVGHVPESGPDVTVALSIGRDDGWDVRWRFPAVGNATRCSLRLSDRQLEATLERTGACFITSESRPDVEAAFVALARSSSGPVEVMIKADDNIDSGMVGSSGAIRNRIRRLLAWDTTDPSLGEVLLERGWPISGPAYLLHHENDSPLDGLGPLAASFGFTTVPHQGLPPGWRLTCVLNVSALTNGLREAIYPDEDPELPKARIRFVGGRRLLLGGVQRYAAYDLPLVEVEAPDNSVLRVDGLDCNEEWASPSHGGCRLWRFRLGIKDNSKAIFEFGITDGGGTLATRRLRLADEDGEGVGILRTFSVDRSGRAARDDEGLRGASGPFQLACARAAWQDPVMDAQAWNVRIADGDGGALESLVAKFLDSLSQSGIIAYGVARDQLLRLAYATETEVQPTLVLLGLRARGHVELEMNAKGHLIRVHAVRPTIYSLPARSGELPLFGVCGSLRLSHWRQLWQCDDFIKHFDIIGPASLPVLRFAAVDEDSVISYCKINAFLYEPKPSIGIAGWAAQLEQMKEDLPQRAMETLASEVNRLHWFKPDSAQFVPATGTQMRVDPEIGCRLFRFDDPQAPSLQLYVLGFAAQAGANRFSHIHDSRWGVWLAAQAFAKMLRKIAKMADACPWPIPYDHRTRDVWLPARLRPPFVLERALILCGGTQPEEVRLSGSRIGDRMQLSRSGAQGCLGFVSLVYTEFFPATWLRYEWVPPEIAGVVASAVGGRLDPLI